MGLMRERSDQERGARLASGHYRVTVYLSPDQLTYLERLAGKLDGTLSAALRHVLEVRMKRAEK